MLKLVRITWIALFLVATPALGERVTVPVGSQQGSDAAPDLPERGELKPQVREQLGDPRDRQPAVGDPPISAWRYDGFTVYFEYDHVIHSVVDHEPRNAATPADRQGGGQRP